MNTSSKTDRNFKIVFYSASILIVGCFLTIIYGHVFTKGVGSADDAYIATGAKNLAFGYGYSSSITPDGSYGLCYFPPGFTTGPTLSLPAACLIWAVGNKPWVPSFTSATINIILLLLIFITIKNRYGPTRALTYFWLFFFLFYSLTTLQHFGHWFVLLGEMPAVLLSILGVCYLVGSQDKRSSFVISGIIFGLAFLAKMVSLLGFLPVFLWVMIRPFKNTDHRRKYMINVFLLCIAFLLPFVVFDCYKLSVLGFEGYINNYHTFFNSFSLWHDVSKAPMADGSFQFNFSFMEHIQVFNTHFGYSLVTLILVAMVVGIVMSYGKTDKYIRTTFILLLTGSFLELIWWTSLSNGRPRYALIGLFLYFAAISFVVLIKISQTFKFPVIIIILIIFTSSFARMSAPVRFVFKHQFEYSPYVRNLNKTVVFLEKLEHHRPFAYTWWATVADIDYSLKTIKNFKRLDFLDESDFQRDLYLVKNSKWESPYPPPEIKKQEIKFDTILFDAPPFQVLMYRKITNK